jgi:glycosyltransferase involved in cell wall biosynthesis
MPVRDYRAEYVREAVDSMLAQTNPDWRLLVVADGPRRAELEDVLGERCADPRIALTGNEGRRLAGALNTGMRRAATEFVAVLFGDDLWERQAVAVLARAIAERPEVDFHHSANRFASEDGTPISAVYPSRPGVTLADFGPASPVRHLLCWRRELGLRIGGMDERIRYVGPDDFDFPWSMAEHGAVFGHVDECLYVIRDHRDHFRLTTHVPRSVHAREIRRIMRKHGVPRREMERFLLAARDGYLRQCMYRSRLDRLLKERLRLGRVEPWRETYR